MQEEVQSSKVSYYVAECMEFETLGKKYENISTIDEAINTYKEIPMEKRSFGNGIGINIDGWNYELLVNDKVNTLEYYSEDIRENPEVKEAVEKLYDNFALRIEDYRIKNGVYQALIKHKGKEEWAAVMEQSDTLYVTTGKAVKNTLVRHDFTNEQTKKYKAFVLENKIFEEKKSIMELYSKGNLTEDEKIFVKDHEEKIRNYETDLSNIKNEKSTTTIQDDVKEKLTITKDTDVNDILEELKNGVKNLMTSERYKQFLDFRSSLYQYSFNNCMLIEIQKPDASMIGSFNFWKKNNRYVNKGENGIKILAPVTAKRKVDIPLYDNKKNPIIDKEGKPKTETVEKTVITGFKLTTVFDIKQTSGEPIPSILKELSGNSSEAEKLIDTIKSISKIPITYENIKSGAKGYYDPQEKKIVLREGMSMDQTAKTLIHEYTHSKLHNDISEYTKNRGISEIQAESTAYVVAKHFGMDTSEYSFGYVTGWANGKDLNELQDTLKVISNESKNIIDEIEEKLSAEYELQEENSKKEIKTMLVKNGFKPTEKVQDNLLKLKKSAGKNITLKDVCDKYKNLDGFEGSENEKKLIKDIGNELKNQELAQKKVAGQSLNIEPEFE